MAIDTFPPHSRPVPVESRRPPGFAPVRNPSADQEPQLPEAFCWTRFGTEAGESFDRILERKEAERRANDGIFLWGIGNSVAPGLRELLRRGIEPEVLFSPIKGQPRSADANPPRVVTWSTAETIDGGIVHLAPTVRVLSRAPAEGSPGPHYALVCFSPTPLACSDQGILRFGALRNLVSGRQIGASQVTAVVSHDSTHKEGSVYGVAFRARLVAPYFLRLRSPGQA